MTTAPNPIRWCSRAPVPREDREYLEKGNRIGSHGAADVAMESFFRARIRSKCINGPIKFRMAY